ncbi:DinB family protein [uncultured Psychroserpens sp.]|uniref:DinB family protein n=1 Tax=uncultured Psychroserpens sp. TaxID=255436 RepID=UPI00262BDAE9|nr:DinB family protein [uncultured Psychroserpens sp.]
MKAIILLFMTLSSSIGFSQIDNERKLALDLLNRSLEEIELTVNSLTEVELNYKPKDGGWTVLNCLEHLSSVEPALLMKIQKTIDGNELDLKKDLSSEDAIIIAKVTDRTNAVNTPKPFHPKEENAKKTKEDFLSEIKATRAKMVKILTESESNLRHLFAPYLYGEADVTQHFLVVGAHSYRHLMQIKELISEIKEL